MSLAELSLKRPVTAVMFYVSLLVIGLIAAFKLPLEKFPEFNVPFVLVDRPYPGSTPEEVERTIIRPVEEALSTLPGIDRLNSVARGDGGNVFMLFSDWNRDIEITASEARDRLDAIRSELPDDLQRYFVFKFSPNDQPLLRIRFAQVGRDFGKEYDLIDRQFKRRLERIPGVARVDISGAAPSEVEVAIDPLRLAAHNLSLNELSVLLRSVNFSVSAGSIDDADQRLRVQPVGEVRDLNELRNLVLNTSGLKLSDIAEIRFKPQRIDYGRRLDGQPAVGIDILRERNSNLVEVSSLVLAEIEQIRKVPELQGIQFNIIDDQADSVTSSINELVNAGVIGALFALLVLFYFLRHWPSTLMVTLAIPICIVITLGMMSLFGLTLNILSMMGLLLGIGMLVDNSVVVVESIYQMREKYPNDPYRCAIEGTRSVQLAISAGTLTSIIVFVPNLFGDSNQISIFLSHVAITITIALLSSWLVAVSLIPMISARLKTPPSVTTEHGFVPSLTKKYAKFLQWTLAHRAKSVSGIALIVLLSFIPMQLVDYDMFKEEDGNKIEMYFDWKGAYSLDQMSEEIAKVEGYLDSKREEFGIEQIYLWYSERGWAGMWVTLRTEGADVPEPAKIKELIREGMPKLARADVGFGDDNGGGSGSDTGIQVSIQGDSPTRLRELVDDIVPLLARSEKLRDVRVDTGDSSTEVQVRVDRDRAASYGFSAQEVAQYIGIALRGTPLREFRNGQQEVPVWARFAGSENFSLDDLGSLSLTARDGSRVPLLSLVQVDLQAGSTQIFRQNRRTALTIQANLAEDVTTDDARKELMATLEAFPFPEGYGTSLGGDFQRNEDAGSQMLLNIVIALALVYILMAALFDSYVFPVAIFSSIFFSMLGVFWLFALTGTTFTLVASIGMLVLMGVVVNNGIVMVEHINNLRREGMDRTRALIEGSKERLRPILMTMGTTVLAMLPLCLQGTQIGGDGPAYDPMARAIVGGLMFSTLVSLLFLPTIYAILDDFSVWLASLFKSEEEVQQQTS